MNCTIKFVFYQELIQWTLDYHKPLSNKALRRQKGFFSGLFIGDIAITQYLILCLAHTWLGLDMPPEQFEHVSADAGADVVARVEEQPFQCCISDCSMRRFDYLEHQRGENPQYGADNKDSS